MELQRQCGTCSHLMILLAFPEGLYIYIYTTIYDSITVVCGPSCLERAKASMHAFAGSSSPLRLK